MTNQNQMKRKELVEARDRVVLQLDRLSVRGIFGTSGGDPHVPLRAQLNAILQEIDTELAELKNKGS